MQSVRCENHFFDSRLFGLSELHLALLGSSRPLPGQSWGPDGTQKLPKATPKLDQKWVQKGSQFWAALGPILGSILEPKTMVCGGHIFQDFLIKSRPRSKHSSFSCFHGCVFFGSFYFLKQTCFKNGFRSWSCFGFDFSAKMVSKMVPKIVPKSVLF